jgi:hemoglobin-like flavoprotein
MHRSEDTTVDDHTIALVKESFDLVDPIAPRAAALFYENLFEADPTLRPLFKGDMVDQGNKLIQMVELAVSTLGNPGALTPALQGLGRRHADFGVQDRHYETFGLALINTLRPCLGVAFTPDVEEAWVEVYGELAGTMKEAAAVTA